MKRTAKQLVMQPCFRSQVVKTKKGKGSFTRKSKHNEPIEEKL